MSRFKTALLALTAFTIAACAAGYQAAPDKDMPRSLVPIVQTAE